MMQGETLTHSLPDDIILDILSQLPVRSVSRFNSVCKCWHSLIRSRRFIEMHLRRGLHTDDRLKLLVSLHPPGFSIKCQDINKSQMYMTHKTAVWLTPSSLPTGSSLFLPLHYPNCLRCCDSRHDLVFMGSCNGLACFSLRCWKSLKLQALIWNPATGAFRLMSEDDVAAGDVCDETPPKFKFTSYYCRFGFGYDSSVDDYKIVRLVNYFHHESLVQVDLLTVGSNKLRRFHLPVRGVFWSKVGALLHGSLHWLMCRRVSEYYILRLNLETEKLDELIVQIPHPPPPHMAEADDTSMIICDKDLSVVDEKLSVAAVNVNRNVNCKDDYRQWVMEEYGVDTSWTKRSSLPYDRPLFRYSSGRPLHISRDGGLLLGVKLCGPLFMCDPKDRTYQRIIFPYVESLVSPFHIPNPNWRFEE